MTGLVEHVCFPCGMIVEDDGTAKVYYGAADTVQCVATAKLDDLIHACKHE
jgi:beta-1,4-mannooligosaccharide/beta-1,4-mannosyl-N-acetylglucosamine phosphorylase